MGSCAKDCRFFGFTTCDESGGYGSNWYCNKTGQRIKDKDGKCDKWEDRYFQKAPSSSS